MIGVLLMFTGDISLQVPSDVKTTFLLEALSVTVTPELHTESAKESDSSDACVLSGKCTFQNLFQKQNRALH